MNEPLRLDSYDQLLDNLNDCSIDATGDSFLAYMRDYLMATNKGLALVGQQYSKDS